MHNIDQITKILLTYICINLFRNKHGFFKCKSSKPDTIDIVPCMWW